MDGRAARWCIFCGASGQSAKITKEHIIGRWLARRLKNPAQTMSDVRVSSTGEARSLHGLNVSAWDRTARWVCHDCNSGWLQSAVDRPARRLILELVQGSRWELSESESAAVALWLARLSLVNNADQQGRDNFIGTRIGRQMMTELRPPTGSSFWIATAPHTPVTVGCRHYLVSTAPKQGWVTTYFTAGETLLVCLLATKAAIVEPLRARLDLQLGLIGARQLFATAAATSWLRYVSDLPISIDGLEQALTMDLSDHALARELHEKWR